MYWFLTYDQIFLSHLVYFPSVITDDIEKVIFYGQGPPVETYYTTVCGINYLSTICINAIEVYKRATPSCSRLQTAMDNGVKDGRSN